MARRVDLTVSVGLRDAKRVFGETLRHAAKTDEHAPQWRLVYFAVVDFESLSVHWFMSISTEHARSLLPCPQ